MNIDFIETSFTFTASDYEDEVNCNDHSNWLDAKLGVIRFAGNSIVTSNYIQKLDSKYNTFVNKYKISKLQNETLLNVLFIIDQHIIHSKYPNHYNEISLDYSEEDEMLITRKSKKGISYVLIDDEGDIMLSFSGYNGKGWRKFVDYEDFNPHEATQSLFSI